jgi:BirA family biotin operon repressor/biotin-[acetyl-CoA-carboxylase] ligase
VDEQLLRSALVELPLSQIEYYPEIGSTNDRAQALLEQGAADGALVFAEAQTRGRGRLGRKWVTTPGAALAFSLALRPSRSEQERLAFFAPLAGLAVCRALVEDFGLTAKVKWPNDVLLENRKACGVLVEAAWLGSHLHGVVLGIGVNVAPSSVPPDDVVLFPATCVEQVLGRSVDRLELLSAILRQLFSLRKILGSGPFLRLWQEQLAFLGQEVIVDLLGPGEHVAGQVLGIDIHGNLRLRTQGGNEVEVAAGDVRLRPVDLKA